MHIGQAVMPSLKFECQFGVVDTQAMQNGRVQIVNVYRVAGDVITEIVCFTLSDAGLHSAAGQPDGEAAGMMIAAVIVGRQATLAINCAAEFAPPNYQGIVQQAELL